MVRDAKSRFSENFSVFLFFSLLVLFLALKPGLLISGWRKWENHLVLEENRFNVSFLNSLRRKFYKFWLLTWFCKPIEMFMATSCPLPLAFVDIFFAMDFFFWDTILLLLDIINIKLILSKKKILYLFNFFISQN